MTKEYREGDTWPEVREEVDEFTEDTIDSVQFRVLDENDYVVMEDEASVVTEGSLTQTDTENDGTFHGLYGRASREERTFLVYDWDETLDKGWYTAFFVVHAAAGDTGTIPRGKNVIINVVRSGKVRE